MMRGCVTEVQPIPPEDRRPWAPDRGEDLLQPAKDSNFTCLSEVDLFADLSAQEIEAMDHMMPPVTFRCGELLYGPTKSENALFILKKGRVRVFRVTAEGKALTLAILEPGAVFGEMPLLGQRMYGSYAEAIDMVSVCKMTTAEVEHQLLADPRIAVRMARLLGDQVGRLEARLTDLALKPLHARAAATLLQLAVDQHRGPLGKPTIRLTHGQIAGLLGATRESTSRAVQGLADDGLIRQARGRIVVVDMHGLRRAADEVD